MYKIQLWLATNLGWYRYYGMIGCEPRHWPKARVLYPPDEKFSFPGGRSTPMALGNAIDYAEMFNGTVVPV